MNTEIPEGMSLFAELKTLAENVRERSARVLWRAADWRRTVQRNVEASQEQRSLVKRRAKKAATSWRRRSGGRRCDGLDNPGAPEALYTARGTGERLGVIDVLHSVPTKRERHRERDEKRRQVLQRHGANQSRHGKRKPTHLVLQRDAEIHEGDLKDREWRIEPSGPGEGRGVEDAQD